MRTFADVRAAIVLVFFMVVGPIKCYPYFVTGERGPLKCGSRMRFVSESALW